MWYVARPQYVRQWSVRAEEISEWPEVRLAKPSVRNPGYFAQAATALSASSQQQASLLIRPLH